MLDVLNCAEQYNCKKQKQNKRTPPTDKQTNRRVMTKHVLISMLKTLKQNITYENA